MKNSLLQKAQDFIDKNEVTPEALVNFASSLFENEQIEKELKLLSRTISQHGDREYEYDLIITSPFKLTTKLTIYLERF